MQERPREEEEEVTSSFIITPPKLSHMTSVYCQDHSEKVQTSRRGKRTPNNHTSLNVSGKCGFHDLRWPEAPQQFRFHCFILQESCIGLPEETALLWRISIIRPHKPENLLFLRAAAAAAAFMIRFSSLISSLSVTVFVVLADIN